jgi:lipoprotein-anchoring transpeptidase ErfK/SrfK
MAGVARTLTYLVAAAAALVLARPDGAHADPDPGSAYIYVSKQSPERLYLIDGGKVVFESPVNTGIHASPTPDGDFRVFASYPQKTMRGTDPVTLRPYNDANVPYAMYFDGGRAIHGFPRHGYGYPQSFGCVELPISKARELYQLLQGGLSTEVVIAQRRPIFERTRAPADRDWVRPVVPARVPVPAPENEEPSPPDQVDGGLAAGNTPAVLSIP